MASNLEQAKPSSSFLSTSLIDSDHIPRGILEICVSDQSCDDQMRSPARQLLWNRTADKHKFPLPSISMPMRITIVALNTMLNVMKNSVDRAQFWPSGRKGTLPALFGTSIEKVRVPRINLFKIQSHENPIQNLILTKPMNAEFVRYKNSNSDESKKRCILYIHGGAYVVSSRRTHRGITSRLAKYADATVFAIDYRLAPQHVFPGPLFDVLSAYHYLLGRGFKPENICFSGDSAGGGLSTAAMLYCRDSQLTETPIPMPGCIAVMSPFNDMTQSLPSWCLNEPYCYLPDAIADQKYFTKDRHCCQVSHDKDLFNPYASPCFARSIENHPICPILIQMGDAERIRDDSIYFATQSMSSSEPIQVEMYQDAVHVFQLFSLFDSFSDYALLRMGQFIQSHTMGNGNGSDFKRKSIKVLNDKSRGYPTIDIPDLAGILNDGVQLCLQEKIWVRDPQNPCLVSRNCL